MRSPGVALSPRPGRFGMHCAVRAAACLCMSMVRSGSVGRAAECCWQSWLRGRRDCRIGHSAGGVSTVLGKCGTVLGSVQCSFSSAARENRACFGSWACAWSMLLTCDCSRWQLMGVEAFLAHHHAGDVGPPPAWGGIADDGPDAPCAVAGMFGCAPMNSSYDYWKNGVPWEGPPVVFH